MDVRRRIQIGGIKKVTSGGSTNGGSYTVNLNSQWQLSTSKANPDSSLYEGVYESFSNYNVDSGTATMTITISGYKKFSLYIRSYAESNYDYVMVGQLDKAITGSTSYSSTDVKAHTRGNQQSGTAISNYTLVEFDNMTGGTHTITIVYRKDGSVNNNDDRGYVLISKNNESYGTVDPEEPGSGESINIDNYLTIEALEDGLTASLSVNACEYCVNGNGNWKSLSVGTATESINTGQTLSFRGELTPNSSNGIGTFTISKKCNLKGNCMSMLHGDNSANNYSLSGKSWAFYELFYDCTTLKSVSANFLPATTLASRCYAYMFNGCTSLVNAPELPATTIDWYCYYSMFNGCSSLTTAPELPATTLAQSCYDSMFQGCTSLTTTPELPATRLASSCYHWMFYGCTNLTTSTYLPATTLASSCYDSMFHGTNVLPDCSNINFTSSTVVASGGLQGLFAGTKVTDNDLERILPKNSNGRYYLPATRLANYSYSNMFQNCTRLTTAPDLPATTLSDSCYYYMFNGCSSLTTAPALPATTLKTNCYVSMFSGCSSLITAPELPATTLAEYCYGSMFSGCSSLLTAPELPATTLSNRCYSYMFLGCTSLTTAPKLPATTLASSCYHWMFYNCSKLNYIKMLATDISASGCLYHWVSSVASSGTFVKHPDMTNLPIGEDGSPSGWTVINDGEESEGDDKVVNKVQLVEGGAEWVLMFDYPINSHLKVNFVDGSVNLLKGNQQYSIGYPIFDKPTIVSIDPLEDDKYIYTW